MLNFSKFSKKKLRKSIIIDLQAKLKNRNRAQQHYAWWLFLEILTKKNQINRYSF